MNKQQGHSSGDRQRELLAILPNLRRFALSLAGSLADADDLLQSTVERVLQRGLPDEAELLPWTMRVCRNLWIDEVRSRKVRRVASSDPSLADEQVVEGEAEQIGKLSLREVQAVMTGMPDEQRAVLLLVAVEGYSYKQAAAELDIPIGTIMSRLARARAALADRIER
ncbi:RNA polymerase sigma factor [Woeseia oceani]|uniref:RNA polymerase subunit sigma-70 n=1 Tax=Woeseia oceani TaxID=1548547 RepID=A0A193LHY9_9GAMM|nr:RNA polymerase sigma factor [Woeseia oceani]ANO52106.1 RNA polymerase subunit sigma-70 [Woeseia oceani]